MVKTVFAHHTSNGICCKKAKVHIAACMKYGCAYSTFIFVSIFFNVFGFLDSFQLKANILTGAEAIFKRIFHRKCCGGIPWKRSARINGRC